MAKLSRESEAVVARYCETDDRREQRFIRPGDVTATEGSASTNKTQCAAERSRYPAPPPDGIREEEGRVIAPTRKKIVMVMQAVHHFIYQSVPK